jgi:hypothetical protein
MEKMDDQLSMSTRVVEAAKAIDAYLSPPNHHQNKVAARSVLADNLKQALADMDKGEK